MLTKTGLHAVRAVVELATLPAGTFAGAADVADRIGAPPNYLSKVLKTLARAGVVRSQRGLGGGFCLARPAKAVSLLDVVEPLEHVSRWTGCILGRPECSDVDPCPIHDRWKAVRGQYLRMLGSTTIADLVAKGAKAVRA
jgi:Rrf2 family protein